MSLKGNEFYKYMLILNLENEDENEIFELIDEELELRGSRTIKEIIIKALKKHYRI